MGGLPQTGPKKFKLFNHLRQTHEIFRVGIYKETIKFNKIWEYHNGGPLEWGRQNSNF